MSQPHQPNALPIPPPFLKSVKGGVQVKGWEGVNLERVAREIGVGGQYLREVLKGNRRGSIELFMRFGDVMGWGWGMVGSGELVNTVLGELGRRRGNGNGCGNSTGNGNGTKQA